MEKFFQAATIRNGKSISGRYKVKKIQSGREVLYKVYVYNHGFFSDWDFIDETGDFDFVKDIIKGHFSIGNEDVKVRQSEN